MSELAETPNCASSYCPACDPDRDPVREVLTVGWCEAHQPKYEGLDDEKATTGNDWLASAGETEAETNRRWCEMVHRPTRRA